jgi:hypothetical protein
MAVTGAAITDTDFVPVAVVLSAAVTVQPRVIVPVAPAV